LPTRVGKSARQRRGAQGRHQCKREISDQFAGAPPGGHRTDRQASGRSGKAGRQIPEQRREQDRSDEAETGNDAFGELELGSAIPAERVTDVTLQALPVAFIAHGGPTTWRRPSRRRSLNQVPAGSRQPRKHR
jgi:hypothetical protein